MKLPRFDPHGDTVQQVVLAAEVAPAPYSDYGLHVGLTHVLPSGHTKRIRHAVPEMALILSGSLWMDLDGSESRLQVGDYFTIPSGTWHLFLNRSEEPATMLFAFGGPPDPVSEYQEVDHAPGGSRKW